MVDVATIAARHVAIRRRTAAATVLGAVREWRSLDPADLTGSWLNQLPRLLAVVSAGQLAAADTAQAYTEAAVAAQSVTPQPAGRIVPASFAGTASDGRDLASLLYLPVIDTKEALSSGVSLADAMGLGERRLRMLVDTQVADAGRAADGVGITADRMVTGYVRVVSASACGRCALLAGQRYAYNTGFARHPHCHCQHVPVARAGKLRPRALDPRAFFDGLSQAEQNRAFTVAGAKAIRDGADIGQIVNARRGIATSGSYVRDGVTHRGRIASSAKAGRLTTTTEGLSKRGFARRRLRQFEGASSAPVRLTPEAIYDLATDRADAIRLLYRYGYLV